MAKKLSLLLAAAAVLAFAVPALANAATGLTQKGVLVPTGNIITGTNTTPSIVTSAKTGNITCAIGAVMVESELTTNNLTKVVAEKGKAKSYEASCKNSTEGIATVKNIVLTKLETEGIERNPTGEPGIATGTATVSFTIELSPKGLVCSYTGTGDVGTFNKKETAEGGMLITITKQPLKVTPAACGATAELDGTFKLATAGTTTPVYLM